MLDERSKLRMDVLQISTVLVDPFDGAIRILGDAQRFGLTLRRLHLEPLPGGKSTMNLELLVPAGSDPILLTSRFARHGAVVSIEQSSLGADMQEDGAPALA